jgi:hypothetical protein
MPRRHIGIVGLIVMLTGLSCNLPLVGQVKLTDRAEVNEVQMGELYRSETGGFSTLTLSGYEVDEVQGRVEMFPIPSDEQSGPWVVLIDRLAEDDITLAQALNYTQKANSSAVFEAAEDITVQGRPALSLRYTRPYHAIDGVVLDYYGADEGEEILGWFVLVEVSPGHIFRIEMFAPSQQWQELLPSFEALLDSLRFAE